MLDSEELSFIERIRVDHRSDLPRLIYADWLDERGDHPKADFIRVQCALESLDEGDIAGDCLREYECSLLENHAREWAKEISDLVEGYSFRRGVIEAVTLTPSQFFSLGEERLRLHPIRRFRFVEIENNEWGKVFRSELTRHISELDFSQCTLDQRSCFSIAKSQHLRNLELLDLGFTTINDVGLEILLNSPVTGRLKSLRLNENKHLDSRCLDILVNSQHSGNIVSLDLSGNHLTVSEMMPLLQGFRKLRSIKQINLEGNLIGRGMSIFVQSPMFESLCKINSKLDLESNEIDSKAISLLAESDHLLLIRSINLDRNLIRDQGFSSLIESPKSRMLESMSLVRCGLQEEAMYDLARSDLIGDLVELDVRANLLTVESINKLKESHLGKAKNKLLKLLYDPNLPHTRTTAFSGLALRPLT